MEPIKKIRETEFRRFDSGVDRAFQKIDELIERINLLTKVKPILIIKLPISATQKDHIQVLDELKKDSEVRENCLAFVIVGDKEGVECFNSPYPEIELEELKKKLINIIG